MYKFTEDGKGQMHLKFFTVIIDKQKVQEDSFGYISVIVWKLLVVLGQVS